MKQPSLKVAAAFVAIALIAVGAWFAFGRGDNGATRTSLYGFDAGTGGEVLLTVDGIEVRERDWELALVTTTASFESMTVVANEESRPVLDQFLGLYEEHGVASAALALILMDASSLRDAETRGLTPTGAEVDAAVALQREMTEAIRTGEVTPGARMAYLLDLLGEGQYWQVYVVGERRDALSMQNLFEAVAGGMDSAEEAGRLWLEYRLELVAAADISFENEPHPAADVGVAQALLYLDALASIRE